ncbi:MAG: hypothetical protein R2932_05315 [Caldilineaceae bacterium]
MRSGNAFFNLAGDYVWGDSDGAGRVGTVPYRWIEVKETGVEVEGGDNSYYCDLPIGFDFPFYSRLERTFCVSTNGFVSFDQAGDAGDSAHDCPLPNGKGNRALIAAIWGDLVVTNAIYYQSFGTAPQRYLVIQWQGVRRYNSLGGRLANFQVVLFENGVIRVAIQEAGELHGLTTTTGIEDYTESAGVTYACNQPGALYDQQAILFVPPGGTIGAAQAQIQFQAVIDATIAENGTQEIIPPNAAIGVNVVLTNSVQIATARAVITRQVATLLNPLDLSQSTFVAEQSELTPERVTRFALVLTNSGLVSATNATLTVALPASLAYEADSVVCTFGSCRAAAGTVSWQGLIAPEQPSTIYFGARLVQGLPDRTPITVTANLADGFGASYPLQTIIVARRSDLSRSQLQFQPRFAEPGSLVTLLALVQNTGGLATNAAATISIPPNLVLDRDSLVCGTGVCQQIGERIQWQGVVGPRELVPIRFTVQIPATTAYGTAFAATLVVDDMDWQDQFTQQTELMAMHTYLLPIVIGGGARYLLYLPWVAQ